MPSVRPAGNRRRALTLAVGLSIAGLLAVLDVAIGSSHVLIGLVVFAPLVAGLFGDPRDVGIVGALATLLIGLSITWNDDVPGGTYAQRIVCLHRDHVHRDARRAQPRAHPPRP